jgi:hypothetical protein
MQSLSKVLTVFDPTHIVGKVSAIAVSMGLSLVAFTWLDRTSPLVIAEWQVNPDPVRAGSYANIKWHLRWKTSCSSVVINQQLVSPSGTITPLEMLKNSQIEPSKSLSTIERSVHIPWTMQDGITRYEATVTMECNPVQRLFPLKVSAPTVFFNVIESPLTTQDRSTRLPAQEFKP